MFRQAWQKEMTRLIADGPGSGSGSDGNDPNEDQKKIAEAFETVLWAYYLEPENTEAAEAVKAAAVIIMQVLKGRGDMTDLLHPWLRPFAKMLLDLTEEERQNADIIMQAYMDSEIPVMGDTMDHDKPSGSDLGG